MTLAQWENNGWVVRHRAEDTELRSLLEVIERDLKQCRVKGVGPDWALSIAYNAALQCARTALFASGFRVAGGESHHFRVIQSLAFTIESDLGTIAQMDFFRKKRNFCDYEAAGSVSAGEVKAMIELSEKLYRRVKDHLKRVRPSVK